jgi:CBS domain-containing protein
MLAAMGGIADLMNRDVVTVAPEDTLGEAAAKMTEKGIGAVVVSDFGRVIGILSERDIMRAVADRIHSSEARVREWMTADPITATTETSVEEAGRTMLEHGFRHLPVLEGERAIGILSIRDVAQHQLAAS